MRSIKLVGSGLQLLQACEYIYLAHKQQLPDDSNICIFVHLWYIVLPKTDYRHIGSKELMVAIIYIIHTYVHTWRCLYLLVHYFMTFMDQHYTYIHGIHTIFFDLACMYMHVYIHNYYIYVFIHLYTYAVH